LTKSFHIEFVTRLTTDAFLAALRRFITRRGKPRIIGSDNGTNFQGDTNELLQINKILQSTSQWKKLQEFLAILGCDLKFVPPHGTHLGLLWEAAMKSTMNHLRRTLGSEFATYEGLCTLLAEVRAFLNSSNLCTLSDNPFNQSYLSTEHFLIGKPLTQLPVPDITDVKFNRLSRWQIYQQQLKQFCHRWSSDYLQNPLQRQRWQRTSPNLQPGDLVLLREDNMTPFHQPTILIKETHPRKDCILRVLALKTPKRDFKRTITKICPL